MARQRSWLMLACLLTIGSGGCESGVRGHQRPPRPESAGAGGPEGSSATGGAPQPGGGGGVSGAAGTGASPPDGGQAADAGRPGDAGPGDLPPGAAPPSSGVTIMIGGVAVPREKAIVVIHLGHSNMAGRAQGPAELMSYFYDTHPNLWRYQKGGLWSPAKEWLCPDGGPDRDFPQGAGPGMALLRRALAAAPDAHVISIGNGQSLDFAASCFSFRKGGVHYPKVMEAALELKGKVTFAGLFVMLGYDGRTDPRAQNGGYLECMKGLAADYRAELGEPELPFLVGDYERGARDSFSPTCCGAPQVIAQLARVPAAIPRTFLIPTANIEMQDNHHYNMTGHKTWADLAFTHMEQNGWIPWASKP